VTLEIPVHEWGSASSDAPGILLLQEIFGVSDYINQRAADLHALGYYVIAPEIYWRLDDTELDESAPDVLISRYDGAGHAFDNPLPMFHNPEASALAWRRTEDFLARHLPTSQG
jgi:dienelactone hydrolase